MRLLIYFLLGWERAINYIEWASNDRLSHEFEAVELL